jgi:hypothetical protein
VFPGEVDEHHSFPLPSATTSQNRDQAKGQELRHFNTARYATRSSRAVSSALMAAELLHRVLRTWRQYQFSKQHGVDVGDIWVRLVAVNCALRALFRILPDENIERQVVVEIGRYGKPVGKFR